MTTLDEWVADVLKDAPPLSPEQLAILGPLFRPAIQHAETTAASREETNESDGSLATPAVSNDAGERY